jgi:hypothetical protein
MEKRYATVDLKPPHIMQNDFRGAPPTPTWLWGTTAHDFGRCVFDPLFDWPYGRAFYVFGSFLAAGLWMTCFLISLAIARVAK